MKRYLLLLAFVIALAGCATVQGWFAPCSRPQTERAIYALNLIGKRPNSVIRAIERGMYVPGMTRAEALFVIPASCCGWVSERTYTDAGLVEVWTTWGFVEDGVGNHVCRITLRNDTISEVRVCPG